MPHDEALEEEIRSLRAAVEAEPRNAVAHRELALALRRAKRRHEALEHFATAVELAPQDERNRLDLALAYSSTAQLERAAEIYRDLAGSARLRPIVLHNLGNIALRLEKLGEAIDYYRQALEAKPDYLLAHYHLGLALQEQGHPQQAYATFKTVVQFQGVQERTQKLAQFDALHRMGSIDLATGQPERAAKLLSQLVQLYPGHPNANFTYGRALMLLGRDAEARRAFDRHLQAPRRQEGRIGFIRADSTAPDASSSRLRFGDATNGSGIDYVNVCGAPGLDKGWSTEEIGAGAAWLDYDGDGLLDLYLVNGSTHDREPGHGEPNRLFRGDGRGHFVDVTARAGVGDRGWGYGVAIGDIDNDGDPDLYVTNYGPNVLYRNNGDGTFTDVTDGAHVGEPTWGVSAAFLDMEQDGDLDLYVGNYYICGPGLVPRRGETPFCAWKGIDVACGPKGMVPFQDVMYRNDGDGTFTDVTRESGMWLDEPRYALGVVTADFDNDGRQDVYVANDSVQNSLWRNNGDGTFTDIGVTTMSAFNADGHSQSGMGTDCGDYDNDGWLDVVVTNFSHDLNTVYRNVEGRYFLDESSVIGLDVSNMMLSWGTGFQDFDLDGDLDLFIANGHIFPEVGVYDVGTEYRQANHILVNEGSGHFVESSSEAGPGFAVKRSFRAAAFGDYDNDGDVDVALTALDDAALLLVNETETDGHYLQIRLVGRRSNHDGIGARVTVVTGGDKRIRERKGGGSFLSANDPRLHFGLGRAERAELIEVRWPSGARDVLYDVEVDRLLTITEGSAPAAN
jgi:Flp pilus assembly protein TadD